MRFPEEYLGGNRLITVNPSYRLFYLFPTDLVFYPTFFNLERKITLPRKLLVIVISMMTLFAVGCAQEKSPETGTKEKEAETSNHLTVDLVSGPSSLDPHGANDGNSLYIMSTMYDTLVELDKNLEIQPSLAESLEQVEETVWVAKIREGVKFHDGSELNAEVVKANLDRVRDPEIGSPVSFLFNMIESVEVTGDYEVKITTEFPFAALPSHLAHPGGHIISLESINKDYEAVKNGDNPFKVVNEQPVGTGYFKFAEQASGEYVKVVKNDDYWGEKAKVDSITFKVVPEDMTRFAELQTGDADFIYPVAAEDVKLVDENEGTHVQQSESANMTYLGMNTTKEPFNDARVRQAISMLIDKEELIAGVLDGIPLLAKGPLAPTVFGYSTDMKPIDYNVEKAKELLAEAGYENGFSTSIMTYDRTTKNIAEYAQGKLAEAGIEASIESAEIGAYLELTGKGESEMFVGNWGTVTLDADYGLYAMFHSDNAGAPGNRSFFANEKVDKLLDEGRRTVDQEERLKIYAEAQQIIVDEAPVVPLFHSVLLAGLSDDVDGFFQYPSSIPYLRDVTFKK